MHEQVFYYQYRGVRLNASMTAILIEQQREQLLQASGVKVPPSVLKPVAERESTCLSWEADMGYAWIPGPTGCEADKGHRNDSHIMLFT